MKKVTFYEPVKFDSVLKSLAEEQPLNIRISGDCMAPLILNGALVQVQPERRYWPGDILVVRSYNNQLIAHRLIGVYPRRRSLSYLTQADSALRPDTAVKREQIIGRVRGGCCATGAFDISIKQRIRAISLFALFIIRHYTKATP